MAKGICLTPNCGVDLGSKLGARGCRGLCGKCTPAAYAAMKRGYVTEEKLMELGLILPRRGACGGGKAGPWLMALRERLGND